MTIQQTCLISNNHNKLVSTNRNFLTSITLFCEEAVIRFSSIFDSKKSTSQGSEILYLNDNSGIINLHKLRTKKAADLATCFDKSEIIAAKS